MDGVPWQPVAVVQRVYLYADTGCTDSGCASPGDTNAQEMRNGGAAGDCRPGHDFRIYRYELTGCTEG